MSFSKRDVGRQMASRVFERFSDCSVVFGNSQEWASVLQKPQAAVVYEQGQRLSVRGLFEAPFVQRLDAEGQFFRVTIPSLIPLLGISNQNTGWLVHNDRVVIQQDHEPLNIVFKIIGVQPSGTFEQILNLQPLGPVCDAVLAGAGFPYTFPIVYGGIRFRECVSADLETPNERPNGIRY